jgi:hypothetical protein
MLILCFSSFFQVMTDVMKFQAHFLHGPSSGAVKNAVNAIHGCAARVIAEKSVNKSVEHFQFSTPQGAKQFPEAFFPAPLPVSKVTSTRH